MKNYRKIRITSIVLFVVMVVLIFSDFALAQFGLERFEEDSFLTTGRSGTEMVIQVIRYIIGIVGIIFLILMIYGGILYATSAGNTDQVEKAKRTLKYSVVGIIIVAVSFSIATFVTTALFTDQQLASSSGGRSGSGGDESGGAGSSEDGDGNDLLSRGQAELDRAAELRRQAEDATGSERQRLLREAEEAEAEGRRLRAEGEALSESGGSTASDGRSSTGRGAADVDTDCQWLGQDCSVGVFGNECCGDLECDEGILDSGWPAQMGICAHGDETCKEEGEICTIQDCCDGLTCDRDARLIGGECVSGD